MIGIKHYSLFYILVVILHIVPAVLVDTILRIVHVRPMLVNLQRKIFVSLLALFFFLTNSWKFNNSKFISLFETLSADDIIDFGYKDLMDFNIDDYIRNALIGCKLYLLNENMSRLEQARRHPKRMDWLNEITKIVFVIMLVYIFYSLFL